MYIYDHTNKHMDTGRTRRRIHAFFSSLSLHFPGIVLFLCLLVVTSPVGATHADLEAELQTYITIFSSHGIGAQRKAIDKLEWAGISDTRLYDVIEANLLAGYLKDDKQSIENTSWQAKALALSGQEKYRATLQKVLDSDPHYKLKTHTTRALKRLDLYAVWNPQIGIGLDKAPAGQLERYRVMNMLKASSPQVVRLGAKRVYHAHGGDVELLDTARDRLLSDFDKVKGDTIGIDAMAWLCKALANSGNRAYKSVLDDVAANATDRKIARYAQKYANYLQPVDEMQ